MLRITAISASQASTYYLSENNVSEEEVKNYSQWSGRGAEQFGLKGKVNNNDFSKILNGEYPNTEDKKFRTRSPTKAEHKERAGLDITFSAPKSISLAVLINGDKQLEQAHREAVETALKALENKYASTKIRQEAGRETVHTGNLTIAQFHHDRSRENDPQLHTHAIVMNATQNENNDWYSLKNDEIFKNQKFISSIYQNELAYRAKQLGYEIVENGKGHFELKGYDDLHLKHFSKRRQQIIKLAGDKASARQREVAALKTRKPKIKNISREELQKHWQAQANKIGLLHPIPTINRDRQIDPHFAKKFNWQKFFKNPYKELEYQSREEKLLKVAIAHYAERQTTFSREDLEKFMIASQEQLGDFSWSKIQKEIDNNQYLIKAKDNRYTTLYALNRELDTIRLVDRSKDKLEKIASAATVSKILKEEGLNEGQYNAVVAAATTKDKYIAWQGKAGAGKTFALNKYKKIAEAKGYTVRGFAPSASAAKTLSDELGIEAHTVAKKLVSSKPEKKGQKEIWIVDEAGLLSAAEAYQLIKKAESENARVLLVGDTRQLSSVGAGNPFKSLQKAGITTAYLDLSLRQKNQILKQAVNKIAEGEIQQGIDILDKEGKILSIGDRKERTQKIAEDYIKLDRLQRNKTLILAGTNKEKQEITKQIRDRLKAERELTNETTGLKFKPKNLSLVEASQSFNYNIGDVFVPIAGCQIELSGLKKNQAYFVIGKEKKEGDWQEKLILKSTEGAIRKINPAAIHQKSAYTSEKIEVAQGDRLRWTKNDNQLGRRNGQEFLVESIDENNQATIRYNDGETDILDLTQHQHIAHNLVSTVYSSQGKTADRVLVSATSDRTLSQESFYVAVSRAKYDLKIYAQDKEQLRERVQQSRSQETSLSVLAENKAKVRNLIKPNLRKIFDKIHNQSKSTINRENKSELSENKARKLQQHEIKKDTIENDKKVGFKL